MTRLPHLADLLRSFVVAARPKAVRRGRVPMKAGRISTRRWLPRWRLARRSRGVVLGGVWLRCQTWWLAQDLDRRLAHGADPMESDELSLRVGQLGSARTRTRLAGGLRGAVELANRPADPLRMPSSVLQREEIRAHSELLLELAERVSTSEPLGVEGLAITSLLIYDAPSPLYHTDASRSLTVIAFEALAGLDHGHLSAPTADR
jgi:hypothetical protein